MVNIMKTIDWPFEMFVAWAYNQKYGVQWLSLSERERRNWRAHVIEVYKQGDKEDADT